MIIYIPLFTSCFQSGCYSDILSVAANSFSQGFDPKFHSTPLYSFHVLNYAQYIVCVAHTVIRHSLKHGMEG